jgi:hypothetical protein
MLEEIKVLLGVNASKYTDEQIGLALKHALAEIEAYCNREPDYELEVCAAKIAVIKLYRMGTEGLSSQSFTGVSESFLNGYPTEIMMVLNMKRKRGSLKVV